jgi:hypothetical protein
VPELEDVARVPQVDFEPVDLARLHELVRLDAVPEASSDGAVAQSLAEAVRVYIEQLGGEVGCRAPRWLRG